MVAKRVTKQEVEEHWVRRAITCLGLRPCAVRSLHPQDPPDVLVEVRGRRIGVEVMEYHRDCTQGASHLREEEAHIEKIEDAFGRERDQWPGVRADGEVTFRKTQTQIGGATAQRQRDLPPKSRIDEFVRELLRFASEKMSVLSEDGQKFTDFGYGFELLRAHTKVLELRSYTWTPIWNFDPEAKTHGFAPEQWLSHLQRKTKRITRAVDRNPDRFKCFDELWLLLVSGPRSSSSVAATLAMFRVLNDEARRSPFQKILIDECWEEGKMWCWCRDEGWSERVHHPDD